MKAASGSAGMALVESLVAITLLGVALAGSAALLVRAIAGEREAALRSTALRQANSLADPLRQWLRGHGEPLAAVIEPDAVADCAPPPGACTLEQWVAARIVEWRERALAELPAASSAGVELLQASPPSYRVTLAWPGSEADSFARVELAVEP